MSEFSNYYENKIIDHMLRGQSFTPPTTIYLALFISPVTDSELEQGTLTHEVSGNGYARQPITLTTASNGQAENAENIEFPAATGDWGTVTHVAIMDAQTGGNVLMYSAIDTPKTVGTNDIFRVNAGDLKVTVD